MAKVNVSVYGTEDEYFCINQQGETIESFGFWFFRNFNISIEVDNNHIDFPLNNILGKIKSTDTDVSPIIEYMIPEDCVGINLYQNKANYSCEFETDDFDISKFDLSIGTSNFIIPENNVYSLPKGCKIKVLGGALLLLGINYDGTELLLEFDSSDGYEKGLVWGIEPGRKYNLNNFYSKWGEPRFNDGLAPVWMICRGCSCFINKNAEIVIPAIFDNVDLFKYNRAPVYLNEKGYGYINELGEIVIECKYDMAREFSNGVACVELNEKYALIDVDGNPLTSFEYDYIWDCNNNGVMRVKKNNKFGYINIKGEVVLPIEFESIPDEDEYDKLTPLQQGKYFGYMNKSAQIAVPFIYEKGGDFNEGLAAVKKGGAYGYINEDGEVVIPFTYGTASKFKNGKAKVKLKGSKESFFINNKGERVD